MCSTPLTLLTTGGTIAATVNDNGALVPTADGASLLRAAGIPPSQAKARDLTLLDSSSITLSDLDTVIAEVHAELEGGAPGVVLTHGTDSLEDTALALDLVHHFAAPVVLTGAQRAFDSEDGDGPRNLRDAMDAAADPANQGRGALVAFGGRLLPARGIAKMHTSSLDAFAPTAPEPLPRPVPARRAVLTGLRVPIVAAWPGADAELVRAAVANGVDGLVVEALGSGNMGAEMGRGVADALRQGVPVVVSTRVPQGSVRLAYGGAGGGATLASLGAVSAGYLTPGQARILLATALAAGIDPAAWF